jgi:hypothetical protein
MAEYYDLRRKARATGAWAAVPGTFGLGVWLLQTR